MKQRNRASKEDVSLYLDLPSSVFLSIWWPDSWSKGNKGVGDGEGESSCGNESSFESWVELLLQLELDIHGVFLFFPKMLSPCWMYLLCETVRCNLLKLSDLERPTVSKVVEYDQLVVWLLVKGGNDEDRKMMSIYSRKLGDRRHHRQELEIETSQDIVFGELAMI